ncbi:MAG: hypothetical protein ACTSR8_16585 [Promethearchaeota archaeon]
MDKREKDILKLTKLVKHWADHNESHKESFEKWYNIALEYELKDVAQKLSLAIQKMNDSTKYLLEAEKLLNP